MMAAMSETKIVPSATESGYWRRIVKRGRKWETVEYGRHLAIVYRNGSPVGDVVLDVTPGFFRARPNQELGPLSFRAETFEACATALRERAAEREVASDQNFERRCWGSGERMRIINPNWPSGDEPFMEATGEDCPGCEDCEGHGA